MKNSRERRMTRFARHVLPSLPLHLTINGQKCTLKIGEAKAVYEGGWQEVISATGRDNAEAASNLLRLLKKRNIL